MHGTGTIGAGGSITGQVKVQRLGTYGNNYNYWSSPIANGNVSSLGLNRYRYNPASASLQVLQDLSQAGYQAIQVL